MDTVCTPRLLYYFVPLLTTVTFFQGIFHGTPSVDGYIAVQGSVEIKEHKTCVESLHAYLGKELSPTCSLSPTQDEERGITTG